MIFFFSIPLEARDILDKRGVVWNKEPTFAQRTQKKIIAEQLNVIEEQSHWI